MATPYTCDCGRPIRLCCLAMVARPVYPELTACCDCRHRRITAETARLVDDDD
jgi:hypothetical protein